MSSLPEMNLEDSEYLCSIDPLEYESWPVLLDIAATTQYSIAETENAVNSCEPPAPPATVEENGGGGGGYKMMNSTAFVEQEQLAALQPQPQPRGLMNRQNKSTCKSNKSKKRKNKYNPANEQGTSVSKKLDHNARERIRRMKLNGSYLALRALLPDYSRSRSKKRWSAPAIVDRVLKYIPDLKNEIETLKLKKQNYIIESGGISTTETSQDQTGSGTTVSVNEVKEGEAIIQICMENINSFTKLLHKVEDEKGICIQSASTLHVSQNRICYHLHIQTSEISFGANYVEGLRDKVIYWLR